MTIWGRQQEGWGSGLENVTNHPPTVFTPQFFLFYHTPTDRQQIESYLERSSKVNHDWKTVRTKVFNEAAKVKKIAKNRETELQIFTDE